MIESVGLLSGYALEPVGNYILGLQILPSYIHVITLQLTITIQANNELKKVGAVSGVASTGLFMKTCCRDSF